MGLIPRGLLKWIAPNDALDQEVSRLSRSAYRSRDEILARQWGLLLRTLDSVRTARAAFADVVRADTWSLRNLSDLADIPSFADHERIRPASSPAWRLAHSWNASGAMKPIESLFGDCLAAPCERGFLHALADTNLLELEDDGTTRFTRLGTRGPYAIRVRLEARLRWVHGERCPCGRAFPRVQSEERARAL